jgi:hypothetical protein
LDVVVRDYGPAPPPDAVRIATELAGALDFAAVVNVTHGMLHPRDVLIAADDVQLTGIGIAQALERIGVAVPVRRPYTAPERLPSGRWDRRADVFSLAAVMFELLFGRRVAGTGEQAREAVTEIAGANVRQLRAVFGRALAEDPAERFDTALEFAEQLKGAFSAMALTFVPPTEPVVDAPLNRPPATLPLDESAAPAEPLIAVTPDVEDLDLHVAGTARYDQAESAPRADPESSSVEFGSPLGPGSPVEAVSPAGFDSSVGFGSSVGSSSSVGSGAPVGSGFSRIEPGVSRPEDRFRQAAIAPEITAAPRKRSPFVPIAAALVLGAVIGALATGLIRNRAVPTVVQMTGAPPPATASAAPRAETIPAEPPVVQVPSTPAPRPSVPESPAASAPRAAVNKVPVPADETGRLLVRSTPAGARVFVDGKDVGATPQTVGDLSSGTHVVRLVQDGYTTEERRVSISADRPAQSITVELVRQRAAVDRVPSAPAPSTPGTVGRFIGVLVVDSRPPGASVFVDGKQAGKTPLEVSSVDAGSHALRIELDGYQRWTSAVRVVAGERNRVTASLER